MNEIIGIKNSDILRIRQSNGVVSHGASQQWYPKFNQRLSGCGPTAASMQLFYLARTREELRELCPETQPEQESFLKLMTDMFRFVAPGMRGVHKTSMYAEGVRLYAEKRGLSLKPTVLEISHDVALRSSEEELMQFLTQSFRRNIPVAFLNLSNGAVHNLDQWHWVLLTGIFEGMFCVMFDQGKKSVIDLSLWLFTNTLGGGFVSFLLE